MALMIAVFMFIIPVCFTILLLTLIKSAEKRTQNILDNGLFADSIVVRVKGRSNHRYTPYVKYVGNDGLEHEAMLSVDVDLPIGRRVRIKYLPGKYDEAIFISQEIEEATIHNDCVVY